MGINKSLALATASVEWNGEEAAKVRGLSPADIGTIIAVHGEDIFEAFLSLDEFDSLRVGSVEDVADKLMADGPKIIGKMSTAMPRLIAFVIACAADAKDDVESIEPWPLPLQFDCLVQIARLTFVGPEGFRVFVGNVQALVASIGAMTNAKGKEAVSQRDPTLDLSGGEPEVPADAMAHLDSGSPAS